MPMNPLILLSNILQAMSLSGSKILHINPGGDSFDLENADNLIDHINDSALQIGGGPSAVNFKLIDSKNVADFSAFVHQQLNKHTHDNKDVLDQITNVLINAWNSKQDNIPFTPLDKATKGMPDGYVPLGNDAKVPKTFIPDSQNEGGFEVVETITDRDNLPNIYPNMNVLVNKVQMEDPAQPGSGIMVERAVLFYCKSVNPTVWIKYLSTNESFAVVNWSAITGIPASTTSDIDDMVNSSHEHSIPVEKLELITEDGGKLKFDNEVLLVGTNMARKMSTFSQATNGASPLTLDDRFTLNVDKLWRIIYNGIKLLENSEYTFDIGTKTVTFINGFVPSNGGKIYVTKYVNI